MAPSIITGGPTSSKMSNHSASKSNTLSQRVFLEWINHTELFESEPRKQLLSNLETESCIHALNQSSILLQSTQSKDVYPPMPATTSNSRRNDQYLEIEQNNQQAFFQIGQSSLDTYSFENSKNSINISLQKVKQEEQKENIDPLNKKHMVCEEPINLDIKCELEDYLTDSGFDSSDSRSDVFEYADQIPKRKCDFSDYPSKKVFLNGKRKDSRGNFEITDIHDKFPNKTQKQEIQAIVYPLKREKEETQNFKCQTINEEETKDDDDQLKNDKLENCNTIHPPINKGVEMQDITFKRKNENLNIEHKIKNEKVETPDIDDNQSAKNVEETEDNSHLKNQMIETQDIKNENINIQDIGDQLINEKETIQDKYHLKKEEKETLAIKDQPRNEEENQSINYQIKEENGGTSVLKQQQMKQEDTKHQAENEYRMKFPKDIRNQLINEKGATQHKYQLKNEEKAETLSIKDQPRNEEEESQSINYQIKEENGGTSVLKQQQIKQEDTKDIKYQAKNEYQMKCPKEAIESLIRKDVSMLTRKSSRYFCVQTNSEFCSTSPPCQSASQNIDTNCGKDQKNAHCNSLVADKLIQNVSHKLSLNGFESSPCFQDAQNLVQVLIQMLRVMMLPKFLATFVHSINCTKDHSKLCLMFRRLIHHVVVSNHHCALKEVYGHILCLHLDSCSQNDCKFPKCQILRQNRKKLFN